ncbi:hypothetical protein K0M31_006915 [Melipona bicolor]|uniref:Uncharacterized protein n=1 Tax=Melipona bicolor TaxID=60889 RepID=A0AA40FR89_9HYME|nr:hypothetical protein K0M31_006915 [Melipona bicolor]
MIIEAAGATWYNVVLYGGWCRTESISRESGLLWVKDKKCLDYVTGEFLGYAGLRWTRKKESVINGGE